MERSAGRADRSLRRELHGLIQDHESSTVFEQPGSIIEAAKADEVMPTEGLTRRLIELSKS